MHWLNPVYFFGLTKEDISQLVLVASILGVTTTTVGEELKYNPRLTKSKEEFMEIMEQLGLTRPARMGN